ncbi:MAG: hypothetical protein ACF8TS_21070 [Maioricimonas sp. JB049]
MSKQTLERIADAVERLVELQTPAEPKEPPGSPDERAAAQILLRLIQGRRVNVTEIASELGVERNYFYRESAMPITCKALRWIRSMRLNPRRGAIVNGVPDGIVWDEKDYE